MLKINKNLLFFYRYSKGLSLFKNRNLLSSKQKGAALYRIAELERIDDAHAPVMGFFAVLSTVTDASYWIRR